MTGRRKTPAPTPEGARAVDSWRRSAPSPEKPTGSDAVPAGSIEAAAASGDRLGLLVALRDHVAKVIDNGCSPRDLVGLSRRLIDLATEARTVQEGGHDGRSPRLRSVPEDGVFDPEAV